MKQESHWESLRARLSLILSRYGAKSALAREFQVTPASVSEWLSGQSAPTAETTLRLLEWVQAEEGKPKQETLTTRKRGQGQKTLRKSMYEKPKGPRRR
jgi:transcriptional regulator with XRE-family HTH domain